MEHTWIPPQETLLEASIEDLKTIFSEAKDRVKETSSDAQKLYERSILVVSASVTALASIIGYIYLHPQWSSLNLSLGTIGAVLFIICLILKKNVVPQDYFGDGTNPSLIMTKEMFTDLEDRRPQWYLLAHLIKKYEERATKNMQNNNKRSDNLKESISLIYSIPFLMVLVLVLFSFFSS